MKIMAGLEKDYDGDRMMSGEVSVGYLPQEPDLTPGKTVREAVSEGVGEIADLLAEYDEISNRFAEPMDDDEIAAIKKKALKTDPIFQYPMQTEKTGTP